MMRTVAEPSGSIGRAEIALDEFALEMKGRRIDDFDIAGWVQPIDDAGRDNDRHHDDEHRRHDHEPKSLGPSDDLLRERCRLAAVDAADLMIAQPIAPRGINKRK